MNPRRERSALAALAVLFVFHGIAFIERSVCYVCSFVSIQWGVANDSDFRFIVAMCIGNVWTRQNAGRGGNGDWSESRRSRVGQRACSCEWLA
jgi:hypothetical protein